MPKLILCEGRTDAILTSYYLKKTANWTYVKEDPKLLLKTTDNEEVKWYKKNGDFLCIFACGGIDNVPTKLIDVVGRNISEHNNSNIFDKIVILIDHDSRSETENIEKIKGWISSAKLDISRNDLRIQFWNSATYKNQQGKDLELKILPMVLPLVDTGNLESFLLDAISSTDANSNNVVQQSKVFVDSLAGVTSIQKNRYKGKAQLGAVLSVFSPEWVFTDLDVRLTSIDWTQYEVVNTAFAILKEF